MSTSSAPFGQPTDGDRGLASSAPEHVAEVVRRSWHEFSTWLTQAHLDGTLDLATTKEVVGQLGSWPHQRTMADLIAEATTGGEIATTPAGPAQPPIDATFADIMAAFARTQRAISDWLDQPDWGTDALVPAATPLGRLPLLTALHGTVHQLAVAQLALVDQPEQANPALLTAGVIATCDTMGAFAARTDVRGSLALVAPNTTVATRAADGNWRTLTGSTLPTDYRGPVVTATLPVLLGITSGQADVPRLYRSGDIRVDDLAGLLRLAPAMAEVPGMPSLGAVATATKWVANTGSLLSRLSNLGRRPRN